MILAPYSHLPRQVSIGRMLVELRSVMTAVDGSTGCQNEQGIIHACITKGPEDARLLLDMMGSGR